jgi:alpha-L-fucosidase 2
MDFVPASPKPRSGEGGPDEPLSLWYRQPASEWVQALPIGNGRLAAMVFGDVENDRLQLNEDTLWAGGPYDPANPDALRALPIVRQLIFDGKYQEAHALVAEKMMAKPLRQMPFQPVGDLRLTFPDPGRVQRYRRDLNLDTAIARLTYAAGGVTHTREIFSSPVDQIIIVRLSADRPRHVTVSVGVMTPQHADVAVETPYTIVMRGANAEAQGIKAALRFQARVRVIAEGGVATVGNRAVAVRDADAVTVLLAAATSYRSYKT